MTALNNKTWMVQTLKLKYFVQSDWRIIAKNLELPYNVKLTTQFVTDRVLSGFKVGFVLLNFQFLCSFL
jgi:hypothetical protein